MNEGAEVVAFCARVKQSAPLLCVATASFSHRRRRRLERCVYCETQPMRSIKSLATWHHWDKFAPVQILSETQFKFNLFFIDLCYLIGLVDAIMPFTVARQ